MTSAMTLAINIADLIAGRRIATLATLLADAPEPTPYPSLMPYALDDQHRPLLLISGLAVHTANILACPRVSLLVDGSEGYADRLAGPRVSLVGSVTKIDKDAGKKTYLADQPSAELYYEFQDFTLYRFDLQRAHLVGGFGKVHWVEGAEVIAALEMRKNM